MGSFSWTRAEHKTERANLTLGDNYKILVPQEFGGGYIVDTYFDYGKVFYCGHEEAFNVWGESIPRCKAVYVDAEGHHFPAREFINTPDDNKADDNTQAYCDLYGILAWWNDAKATDKETNEKKDLEYYGNEKPTDMYSILKNGLTWLQDNRCAGISIGCYEDQIDKLKYPLKLVSMSYKGTYEECKGKSYSDCNQGFEKGYWSDNDYIIDLEKLVALEKE